MKWFSSPSSHYELLPNQNFPSVWGSCSVCFSQPVRSDSEPPKASGMCFSTLWGWNWFTNHFSFILRSGHLPLHIFTSHPSIVKTADKTDEKKHKWKDISRVFTDSLAGQGARN